MTLETVARMVAVLFLVSAGKNINNHKFYITINMTKNVLLHIIIYNYIYYVYFLFFYSNVMCGQLFCQRGRFQNRVTSVYILNVIAYDRFLLQQCV